MNITSGDYDEDAAPPPPVAMNLELVERAAKYLAGTPPDRLRRPIVPMLRSRFGLSAVESIEALRQWHRPEEERS